MPDLLARLRPDLDIVPSPLAERPGLLVRDPFRFSEVAMVIPPPLVRALACFDGLHTREQLREVLLRLADGAPNAERLVQEMSHDLASALSSAGFLEDETLRRLRAERHARFSEDPVRPAAFAGSGYPAEADVLGRTLDGWLDPRGGPDHPPRDSSIGVAAPHASPSAGVETYRAAYRALQSPNRDRENDCTYVVLGTSHYGGFDRFGLTRKPFRTPLGETTTAVELVDELVRAVPGAVDVEDYCHAVEHSIEFQVIFLQRLFGPTVRILPILCGPFSCGLAGRPTVADGTLVDLPERIASVRDALGALGELHRRQHGRLRWVLGVDMAHMGPRYGDAESVRAGDPAMTEVAALDRARLERVAAGDPEGFWRLAHPRGSDALKWCGSAPLYTFMRAVPEARGRVLHYDQWNIDDTSVVTFAALQFEG